LVRSRGDLPRPIDLLAGRGEGAQAADREEPEEREQATAHADPDERPGNCEEALVKRICRKSCTRPTAGDYCVYWMNRTCPLARFGAQAVTVLQALPALHVLANQDCPQMGRCSNPAQSSHPWHNHRTN
jgi:hypothetical protein